MAVVRWALDVLRWAAAVLSWAAVVVRRAVAALGRAGPGRIWAVARWQLLQWLPLDTWTPPHPVESQQTYSHGMTVTALVQCSWARVGGDHHGLLGGCSWVCWWVPCSVRHRRLKLPLPAAFHGGHAAQ